MENNHILILIILAVVCAIIAYLNSIKSAKERLHNRLIKSYGKKANKKISVDELEQISHFYKNSRAKYYIDDITWNDLDMDRVYKAINNTNSSIGQEYLYKMLREPINDEARLKETDNLADSFDGDEDGRIKCQKIFAFIGYAKHMAVSDYVGMVVDLMPKSNVINYLSPVFLIVSLVIMLFVNSAVGILLVIAAMAFSVITYYRFKADVEKYFVCIGQIVKMIKAAKDIRKLNLSYLADINEKLSSLSKEFDKVYKNAGMLENGNVTGSLSEILLDYLRMLTHIDLIKFNNMVKLLNNKEKEIYELMNTLGYIESCIAIASFRKSLDYYSKPEFVAGKKGMEIIDVYHPLIANAVSNSLTEDNNILLTGSNASGKSTFLKTVAINAILSQTIFTSVSKKYKAPKFRIFSSMALRDDLEGNDSYYIVEIKSIKRIFDAMDESDLPVLIFIDEILKGTNTVERVAASTEILKNLSYMNAFIFAATHDVELTTLLEGEYKNYHFQENVTNDQVLFDYKLLDGAASTRNAIKLLKVLGFKDEIVENSNNRARAFLNSGLWS
ncbi:MutS-related protein [Lachnospira multipara]|uniref:MutS-related protein n=1 Tax=Lachnospira multipara TaxID=28051 RepID=UPI0004E25EA4|nr:hypothetical protein [Lachnospira multipara]